MEENWNEVTSEIWNPEPGESISGKYLGVQEEVGENKSNLYSIELSDGKQIGVWGSKVLDGKMMGIVVGQKMKILFVGKIKPLKGKEYKDYKVFTQPLEQQKDKQ